MVGLNDMNTLQALKDANLNRLILRDAVSHKTIITFNLALFDNEGRIFLVKNKSGNEAHFSMITSYPNANESFLYSVIKKTSEKADVGLSAIDINIKMLVHRNLPENNSVDFYFEAFRKDGNVETERNDKGNFKWFYLNELPNNMEDHFKFALDHWDSNFHFFDLQNGITNGV